MLPLQRLTYTIWVVLPLMNGAAARRAVVGDVVIIISYAQMDFEEAKTFTPTVVFPKEGNKL